MGGTVARAWHYWSLNKLEILAEYMPAFNTAGKRASERIYLDLMAGQPENTEAGTGRIFDGSARLALASTPGFTRFAFGEIEHAEKLAADLSSRHPDKDFKVYEGDCNETVHQMLADLAPYRWAPTFAFLDQQGAELQWTTMATLAGFRRAKTKVEQWILCSPTMIYRGASGTNGNRYAARVDRMYGTDVWRSVYEARRNNKIDADTWRREMVNLLRWRLEHELGYLHTARIPMRMRTNVEIYDMVFATDHPAGLKIMEHLYAKAADREPRMREEVLERLKPVDLYSNDTLFDMNPKEQDDTLPKWKSEACWDPGLSDWWPEA
jgi:three-Cys-motif partner protein